MALNFFRTPKHQRYLYIPRFYDPEKEELQQKLKRDNFADDTPEAMKARISAGLRRKQTSDPEIRKEQARRSNRILFMTIIALIILSFILIDRYLPLFLRYLE